MERKVRAKDSPKEFCVIGRLELPFPEKEKTG